MDLDRMFKHVDGKLPEVKLDVQTCYNMIIKDHNLELDLDINFDLRLTFEIMFEK